MFQIFFNHSHHMFVLYRLVAYHWKGLKEGYNFVVGSTSIQICMKKLKSHKILDKFVP